MIIVITLLVGAITIALHKTIRKSNYLFAMFTVILAILGYIVDFGLVTQGMIGLALFILVMFAGALKPKSSIGRKLRSIRKELSIGGFILLIPHFVKYLIQFFTGEYPWEWYGVAATVVMVPLFIMSFKGVRQKLTFKKWKSIQRYSYLAYVLIFVHVILLGDTGSSIAYSLLFVAYTALKYINYYREENDWTKTISRTVMIGSALFSVIYNVQANMVQYREELTLSEEVNMNQVEDGIYLGIAKGYKNYYVEIEVEVLNHEIVGIAVLDNGSTRPHEGIDFDKAVHDVLDDIVNDQSLTVDTISGATASTAGAMDAVVNAFEEYKIENTDS